ncbi:MAG: hypothetical protein UW46_C0001G0143 [Candidatus Yanofskybacteria bacterium GW2011_GWF1_44_227]|uniref:Uncharacterized protein n=1 Tax=Candidatus Yanofskybacteria bacterium GW2011_GWE2_40_11 TaxID=1619033 RepID=A0A0G0QL82_9BACT|nr:MAG: hypothetical protein UT69_C0013G0072 [Candidatus Yanofskybacteria bacterium GW2011_GWE1_40_10]KKR41169.1 MAG: hypothetical protein UT75_C0001G0073 [Candidatus Yanofskybacteria bacterium GW2011_GWE2_40_11]KKT15834.1 MAG: hypothetical protein UV97_C0001G0007 [Candidatus Yanofskybacteria bacterium GW2011_GWF2_43_596]KKT53653.1 MAG: hypothetical protein UW46_C0001G0143 [Candidatus Yanofskybacteria bacterium GW2011_GWF1_44_227]OGN38740.1 MAG: hypothetical protein A2371_03280 [Candidatus Yano
MRFVGLNLMLFWSTVLIVLAYPVFGLFGSIGWSLVWLLMMLLFGKLTSISSIKGSVAMFGIAWLTIVMFIYKPEYAKNFEEFFNKLFP